MNQEIKTKEKSRRRLNPEIRRKMILDQAAIMVAKQGINLLSMEKIAKEVNVSKALIYNYFQNITELLRELLQRELQSIRKLQFEAVENATTFEELVRNTTREYLSYIDKNGLIIEKLLSEPSVSNKENPTGFGRNTAVIYLAKKASKNFNLPLDVAISATEICFGLPISAGDFLLRSDMQRQELEDMTVAMILGTFATLKNNYSTRNENLKLVKTIG